MIAFLGRMLLGAALGVLAVLTVAMLSGCSSLGGAKLAANALDAALVEVAPDIEAECIEPYAPARVTATDLEERMRQAAELRAKRELSGCRPVLRTYDDARITQHALHATIGAIEVGACAGVSKSVKHCNVAAAMLAANRARSSVIEVAARLRGRK